jgi:PIN domain nuclease of toxin-antitoxin system
MDLLLDTNAFLWFCEDNPKISSIANNTLKIKTILVLFQWLLFGKLQLNLAWEKLY